MQQHKFIFIYGFALFAMFFGSGNLIFPIQVGQATGQSWLFGYLGLFITGIILPFLGLMVIKLYKGSYMTFFGEAGGVVQYALPLFTLSLLGSFGIIPRCITVAHGSLYDLFPGVSLFAFSLLFSVLIFFLSLSDGKMLQIIGKWLSPLKLSALLILIFIAFLNAPDSTTTVGTDIALTNGFLTGYQTMDLFAAFFFSALIFSQIEKALPESASPREAIKAALKPSIVGASLIALVYFGFVYLGSHYAHLISDVSPTLYLPTFAKHTMGETGTWFIAFVMPLSCLTTAVALNNIYARYLYSIMGIENNKFPLILIGTTSISFVISLLDFKGIAAFLAPALEVSYPGVIALTLMSMLTKKHKNLKMGLFYAISLAMLMKMFL
jgi:LIVCS family branched-chain amino acid:cation transporter